MEENKPSSDPTQVEGTNENVAAANSGTEELTLEEINKISGRTFASKDDFFKHYENLKGFVGKKVEPAQAGETNAEALERIAKLEQENAESKKELAKQKFIGDTPTAKEAMPALEAFAKDRGLSLEDAWKHDDFQPIANALATRGGQGGKTVITNSKITPVHNQRITELSQEARTGNNAAQTALVTEVLGDVLGIKQ